MKETLRGAVEAGNIVCLGVDTNREEILKFAGDMTAEDFRDAADYEDKPRVRRFTINAAQWMEAKGPKGAMLKELV